MRPHKRIEILGCPVDNLTMQETIETIDGFISAKKPHQHVVINAAKLVAMQEDAELRSIISRCDIINADGMPIVWISRLFGNPLKARVTGIDLMIELIKHASHKQYRVYFLGAREHIVSHIVLLFKQKYPQLIVAGYRNGYWEEREEGDVIAQIKNVHADILFLAINSPKKEKFLSKYLAELNVPFVMGVGGSFDVVAGYTKRAPKFLQNIGLEWLWRLTQEPGRMWKRYLITNTRFILIIIRAVLKKILRN
ncbi:MAG: WecB/TagA/CpsF family glycosyltransferase [bacterium]